MKGVHEWKFYLYGAAEDCNRHKREEQSKHPGGKTHWIETSWYIEAKKCRAHLAERGGLW